MAGVVEQSGVRKDVLLPDAVRKYLLDHKLESVVTCALNSVVENMPVDPYAALADELSRSSTSAPRLTALSPDTSVPRSEIQFQVVVVTRGVRIRIHTMAFARALAAPSAPASEAGDEPAADAASGSGKPENERRISKLQAQEKLVAFLQDFFSKSFGDACVDDYLTFHERCSGLSGAPMSDETPLDVSRATVFLTNELLYCGAAALNTTCLPYMQRVLSNHGLGELVSPPLIASDDVAAWRTRWPRFTMPLFHGGSPSVLKSASLRVCVALSPFALLPPPPPPEPGTEGEEQEDTAIVVEPPAGWVASVVEVLRSAQAEAVKLLQADKAMAALLVDGIAYGPPGDPKADIGALAQTLQMAQKAAETAVAALPGSPQECSGVLLAHAQEAWVEAEGEDVEEGSGSYEFETGKRLTLEELVDFYAAVLEGGWIRTIVNPFRLADAEEGCKLLHEKMPELKLVQDYGTSTAPSQMPEGAVFSGLWKLPETLSLLLKQYAEQALLWQEMGTDGFGYCTTMSASVVSSLPAVLEALMACSEVQLICLDGDCPDEGIKVISDRIDDVLFRAHLVGARSKE
eukprot:TRINITY_DN32728_c0_g1_i1.p1 TRINITY_DN32728_c0_g1~~TRINITY_DN32728_c0_g1_i1.p1  ORF type:complete len:575 (+),score=111.64 TRINITY_DN32728_c0_g1_i1:51-1775(+)